jgi:acetolactate decarboxylase
MKNKKKVLIFLFVFLFCINFGFSSQDKFKKIYQISFIDALLAGNYEGKIAIKDLLKFGDTGIGTFEDLDGEMIVNNGQCFRANENCEIEEVKDEEKTPFATVSFINYKNDKINYKDYDFKSFQDLVLDKNFNINSFYLIKLEGFFHYIKVRSVPKQSKPYRKLVDIVKQDQKIVEKNNVYGTLIGFYCPNYFREINVGGFHLHFIDKENKFGGHVLDFNLETGSLFCEEKNLLLFDLADTKSLKNFDFENKMKDELKIVEKGN